MNEGDRCVYPVPIDSYVEDMGYKLMPLNIILQLKNLIGTPCIYTYMAESNSWILTYTQSVIIESESLTLMSSQTFIVSVAESCTIQSYLTTSLLQVPCYAMDNYK